jgi:membrane associated rhomboid family serine protease/Zn-finger nucleic acid-binding protein
MRKYVPRTVVNSLWHAAKSGLHPRFRRCPSCNHNMTEVPVPGAPFAIDVCTGCGFVWFDADEYQQLPKVPCETKAVEKKLSPELAQRLALHRVEAIRRNARAGKESPDEAWKYIPALLGVPVEFDCEETRCVPYATLILLIIIAAVSLLGFAGILTPAQFGLIPAEWSRLAGLTFFTSFFLHGGLRHLAGNLYYLFVFGDNVEDVLGWRKFLVLLAVSILAGGAAYVLTHSGSGTACIGASGGISGILAYYALRFPKHRIGVLIFFVKWLRFPVTWYFGFWVLLQFLGAAGGRCNVAYEAHLGGMLAGTVWFLTERLAGDRQ